MYEDQIKLKNEEENRRKELEEKRENSMQEGKRKNNELRSKRENSEVAKRYKNREEPHERKEEGSFERRKKLRVNFFAKGSDLKRAIVERQQMILLVYKESFLNFEECNPPSLVQLFLYYRNLEMYSRKKCLVGCHPFDALKAKLTSYPGQSFQIDQLTELILRRQKNFKGKWRS